MVSSERLTLQQFNAADPAVVTELLRACLDIPEWAEQIERARPYQGQAELAAQVAKAGDSISWDQVVGALDRHPRIGEKATGQTADARWSAAEQSGVKEQQLDEFGRANVDYEARFGYIFLICASGLTGEEMLTALRQRLANPPEVEHDVVVCELKKIADLRLAKAVQE